MSITIHELCIEDGDALLEFELANRKFFERVLPPRPKGYYDIDYNKRILEDIIREQENGLCHMYLIKNEEGIIVGRVNLFSIAMGIYQKAEIGYRIGEEYNGCGYGTKAVAMACDEAFNTYNIHKIEAGTAAQNIGSQIVLLKNKFSFVGKTRHVLKLNDNWIDGLLFELINE